MVQGKPLYFRGHRILHHILSHLKEAKGLANASQVLVTGCSAGGLATILHADTIRESLGRQTVVKAAPFSGFFPIADNVDNKAEDDWPAKMENAFRMQNVSGSLNKECLSDFAGRNSTFLCFFAEVAYKYVELPIFLINSAYDAWTVLNIYGIASSRVHSLVGFLNQRAKEVLAHIEEGPQWTSQGGFIHSCLTHCGNCNDPQGWSGTTVNGTTAR